MAVKISPDYIDLLNKAVEREIQVSLQYILQHAKMEKLVRRTLPENILLDKTTYDAVGKILREIAIQEMKHAASIIERIYYCLLYTSPSPRDRQKSRMPSSA